MIRAELNIRSVFALVPNSGSNGYSVFGRIVAARLNTNSGHVTYVSAYASQCHIQLPQLSEFFLQ